jgi:hypothetical protein
VLNLPTATLILTGAIGCVTAYIAIQQWRTNKNKLRLDLFDRRWAVFDAAMKLAEIISIRGNLTFEEVYEFGFATRGVQFLFNQELQDYCHNELYKEALAIRTGKQKIDSLTEGEERDHSTILLQDRIAWFNDQRKEIPKRFAPFLKIRG